MAYEFTQASQTVFTADNQISHIATPFTMSVRARYRNTATTRSFLSIYRSGSGEHQYYFRQNSTNLEVTSLTTSNAQSSVAGPGLSTWFNALGTYDSTSSRTAYADTTAGTTNTVTRNVTATNSLQIGYAPGRSNYFLGELAEYAIWDVSLNTDEINSLSKGFKPFRIRPQSLLYYMPLVRDVHEIRQSVAFTASATAPTVFAHPRVY